MGQIELFDGNDSENDDISKIEIDEDYARRFEHNKKREGLQRLEELKKKGVVSSSSSSSEESESESSDDDDYENLISSSKGDMEFIDALIKLKNRDPSLKQKDVKLFGSDHSSDEEKNEKKKDKKEKNTTYLKEVMPKYLIEDGPDLVDREGENDEKEKGNSEDKKGKYGKFYDEEQKKLVKDVLEAAGREDEDLEDGEGGFFRVKEKTGEDRGNTENEEYEKKVDEYFGADEELDENSKFLKNFFKYKMWNDKTKENSNVDEEELRAISEDEREIERQEQYELWFQKNQGDRVLGHARKVEGSVRKKTNARKEQRKRKEERLAIVKKEREEELKHLKNLKKQEMQEKVKRIMKTAGIQENDIIPMTTKEIEEEFDPEEYDRMMKKAFDEKYYNAEDADPEFCSDDNDEMEKPDFEKEDELLGLPKGWDEHDSDEGFSAAREKALKQKMENLGSSDFQEGGEDDEEKIPEEGKRKRKRKTALLEKARQAMVDEYYKLDYEDTVGDLKTRFKYAKTKPNRYGLAPEQLLMIDDKELNQYIPLKKLAPYREEEWKLSNLKRYQLKKKIKEILGAGNSQKKKKDKKSRDDAGNSTLSIGEVDNEKAHVEESNVDTVKLSRKAKRKQRQADLKLSHSRLVAYNKTQPKSKGGRKH